MHFTAAALFAILATNVLAAPSSDANANILVSDITVAPFPQEALDNLAVKAVSPGPAANVVAVSKREDSERDIEKRDITHLYICQDINFSGRCQVCLIPRPISFLERLEFLCSLESLDSSDNQTLTWSL
jgi:hypothetical protein